MANYKLTDSLLTDLAHEMVATFFDKFNQCGKDQVESIRTGQAHIQSPAGRMISNVECMLFGMRAQDLL